MPYPMGFLLPHIIVWYFLLQAEKDMEWKFDRSKLYLEYMKAGNTLSVPYNLVPTWWGIAEAVRSMARCCCCCRKKDRHLEDNAYTNQAFQVCST